MSFTEDYMLPCINKAIFGFDCMGCGLQRSLYHIYHGNFLDAFKMYPAIFTLIPLALIILISIFYKFKHVNKIINGLAIASISIIIINFIVKQII